MRQAIEEAKIAIANAEYTMEPTDTVLLDEKDSNQMIRLIDKLEEDEDVQNVHANFEMPEEILATVGN